MTAGFITTANLQSNIANAGFMAANQFTAANVVALVNGASSSVTINANKINLNSNQTTFISAVGNYVTVKKLETSNGIATVKVNNDDGLKITYPSNNNIVSHIGATGYVNLGSGSIVFDSGTKVKIGNSNLTRDLDVYGKLTSTSKLTVSSGGMAVTGASSIAGSLTLGTNTFSAGQITCNGVGTSAITTTKIGNSNSTAYIQFSTSGSTGSISFSAASVTHNGATVTSDENLKTIINNVDLSVEDISATRTVNYEFNEHKGIVKSGAIAQDWQKILPNVVSTIDEDKHLGLDYAAAALVSSVVDAREIVKLKKENAELKERLAAIEARLGI